MRSSLAAEAIESAKPFGGRSDSGRASGVGGRRIRRQTLKIGLDIAALMIAAVAAEASGTGAAWTATTMLLCLSLLALTGQYRVFSRSSGEDLRSAAAISAIASMAAGALAVVVGAEPAGTDLVIVWLATMSALTGVRALLAGLDARRWFLGRETRRTLIVGAGQVSRAAARRFADRPGLGLEPVGFLDLDPLEGDERDPRVLGASWDLDRVLDEHRIDSVLVGFSSAPHHVLLRTIHRCWDLGVEVMVVPRLFEVQGSRSRTRHVGALPLVGLARSSRHGPSLLLKGAFDRVVALLSLVLLSPLMLLIAVLVKLTSEGPVLHRAPRVGKDGQPFDMLKFRSMTGCPRADGETHADWAAATLREANSGGANVDIVKPAKRGEDACTSVGKVLRRWAMDELPQLWSVVRGDMALVGPRPELVAYTDLFSGAVYRYEDRHRVRPGITGWAQVQGLRGKTSLADRIEWDNFYIENWSFWFDLKILALTAVAVWRS